MTTTRRALPSPGEDVVVLTRERVEQSVAAARENERRRIVQPLHRTEQDLLRRMLNALEPDSYVRPHRHAPDAVEAWLVVQGSVRLLLFDDAGGVQDSLELSARGEAFGVDFVAGVYHTVIALEPDTVLYEVKLGPYAPATDKELASWAPAEGSPAAQSYLEALRRKSA